MNERGMSNSKKLACFLSIVSLVLQSHVYGHLLLADESPTTPRIGEIFIGRCYDKDPSQNCTHVWNAFFKAAKKAPSLVRDQDWDSFFSISSFSTPPNNALFWSGNGPLASALSTSDDEFTNLEETTTGYSLNGLSWCGTDNSADLEYSNPCYFPNNSSYYGMEPVWRRASKIFAQNATGNITVLLQPRMDSSTGRFMAFRNSSIFASEELPNLNRNKIAHIKLLVVLDSANAPLEKCGSGSLLILKNLIFRNLGREPECEDKPKEWIKIYCRRDKYLPLCIAADMGLQTCGSPNATPLNN